MGFYESYHAHKAYTTPTLGAKHAARFDREFWRPAACTAEMSVLEIGCGTGLFLAYLEAKGVARFLGVDHDENLKDIVPAAVRDKFVAADLWRFLDDQPAEAAWDRVAMFDVLEHFSPDDGLRLLQALTPLLKPGARVVIKTPNMASPWGPQFQYGDLTHRAAYAPESMRQLATAAGYRCVMVYPHELGSPRRRVMDRMLHAVWGYVLMTPPEIWSANFFSVLAPDDGAV